ncbi:fibronectin type III domain-containing protein [Candidatus Pacearchaeota archaeon]|nr:fibronectin type III domain-containing protein [Candidatus Pacearchaeota archaeon]
MKKEIIIAVITLTFLLVASFVLAQENNNSIFMHTPNFIEISSDITPPVSSVTFFTNTDLTKDPRICEIENGIKKAYINYFNVVGHGVSNDNSGIIDIYRSWDKGNFLPNIACEDGSCHNGESSEDWYTDNFVTDEGWHNLSVFATDIINNNESKFNQDNTCSFCVDKSAPGIPGTPIHSDENSNRSDGIGPSSGFDDDTGLTFSWTESEIIGCAVIDHYEAEVHFSNGTLWKIRNTTDDKPRITISGAKNNEDFFVRVRAIDKAGNPSSFSEDSEPVNVDTENPITDVFNGDDGWKSANFDVSFKDSDAERFGLWFCQYKLACDDFDSGWINRSCSDEELVTQNIDISNLNIEGTCQVSSRAVDFAGNVGNDSLDVMIDTKAPTLSKQVIDGPSHDEGKFITTETIFKITATDSGSGVKQLCFKINDGNETCVDADDEEESVSELSTTFNFEEESEHNITFRATDNKGMMSGESQTHFVEEKPPITTKTYSMLFQKIMEFAGIMDFLADWIGPKTKITLQGIDQQPHPSGVASTSFRIFSLDEEVGEDIEFYGNLTRKWYNDEEKCITENMPKPTPSPTPNGENNAQQGENNCIAVGWTALGDWQKFDPEEGIPIPGEKGAHKICFKSIDNLFNEEEEQCQVFFVDPDAPTIIPLSIPDNQCQKSINAIISDEDTGVASAEVQWVNPDNETDVFLTKSMTFFPETNLWDASFFVDDLGMLAEGDYKIRITAKDKVGNMISNTELSDILKRAVCVRSITPSQCSVSSLTGGNCMFNFDVIVRGGNAVQMDMSNVFGLSPQNLSATISNSFGTKSVGNLALINGGILQISNSTNKGTFKLNMNIPPTVTGSETINYTLKPKAV